MEKAEFNPYDGLAPLSEIALESSTRSIPQQTLDLLADGRSRFKSVYCFSFVPSDYEMLWAILDNLPKQRFCEWGSGFGLATGMASQLGFDAVGMEIDAPLAEASRKLLLDHSSTAKILTLDYLTSDHQADVYFVYCWPSSVQETEAHFYRIAPPDAKLLICNGQQDIRCKIVCR